MNNYRYLTKRPHLALAILIALVTFILLTMAAANHWFQDESFWDFSSSPPIAEPALTPQGSEER